MTIHQAATAATLTLLVGTASADISMRFIETATGRNVSVSLNSNTNNYFAGQLVHEIDSSGGPTLAIDGRVNTFCVEIEETTSNSFTTFQVSTLDDQVIPAAIGANGNARTQAVLDVATAHYLYAASDAASANEAAAFQLLLWEIIYDYDASVGLASIDPTAGNLVLTKTDASPLWSGVSSLIASYAAAIGTDSTSRNYSLLTNAGQQDQLVPTPGSIALLGAFALVGARRRR